ncbi:hypothetical protein [Dyella lutea]|uniref:Nuclear transport factor 2 family protein n=1 Tax=Dyella lutea TaxID=2950441 RepID=A0ABT1FBS8_9GAMM|nr:hypothetical protein [Dyella lutea]MCP1374828.1 hypothetical protein [Dyella lutea]
MEHTLAYSGKPRRNDPEAFRMRLHRCLFLLFVAVVSGVLGGCHRVPAEEAVRHAVTSAEHAAEAVDAGAFRDRLSEDFTGNRGQFDRRQLVDLLRLARLRGETIHVLMGPMSVEPRGDRFLVTFTVTLSSGGRLLPSDMGIYRVESAWRREGGDWVCYAATWSRPR